VVHCSLGCKIGFAPSGIIFSISVPETLRRCDFKILYYYYYLYYIIVFIVVVITIYNNLSLETRDEHGPDDKLARWHGRANDEGDLGAEVVHLGVLERWFPHGVVAYSIHQRHGQQLNELY
jgi:hypothetical protein